MASLRELRRRIRSVASIKQITRALEMVAITKLRRYQGKALAARPYTDELLAMLARLAPLAGEGGFRHPLFQAPPRPRAAGGEAAVGILLVTSDRGYCGSYNTKVFEQFHALLDERRGAPIRIHVVGRKGYAYLVRRGREVARYFAEPPLERIDFRAARLLAQQLVEGFLGGAYGELHVVATRFVSMVSQRAIRARLLPLDPGALLADAGGGKKEEAPRFGDTLLEPDARTIFEALVPKVLETKVYHLLLESLTAEYAARRLSMKNATDAAEEMRQDLWRLLNRARQERITKELLEIVGGAEALRSA
ncbi:MAG TPA: ATP synthase F1 subunit gamma [Planctomycetota bacterium]|jgi:F-type H+-transporting ATPase subunit gamma|nr:ATP synthase F1 subunit gamma [Planctomycetota bacterium]